jgi:hypothetical protein
LVIKTKLLRTSRLRRALSKASITWDHPCYLFTYNYIYISYACYHLDDRSKIIDDCYPEFLVTYLDMHLGSSC